jgi:hypothetical protein
MSDNNGWPGKPGVPLNADKSGWHWLLANTNKGPQPDAACWDARLERWFVQGCEDAFRPNQIMNRGWLGYLGPVIVVATNVEHARVELEKEWSLISPHPMPYIVAIHRGRILIELDESDRPKPA